MASGPVTRTGFRRNRVMAPQPVHTRRRSSTAAVPSPVVDSWDSAARAFLEEKRRANLSPSTLDIYEDALLGKRITIWRGDYGVSGPADITAAALKKYQLELSESGLAATTVHIAHRVLKTFLRWLDSEGHDIDRQATRIQGPRLENRAPDVFTAEQERWLMECARCERDRFLMQFMLGTGARLSEVAGVTVDDVIEMSLPGADGRQLVGRYVRLRGKGRKDRYVPLGTPKMRLDKKLDVYVAKVRPRDTRQRELFLTSKKDATTHDFRPLDPQSVAVVLKRIAQETERFTGERRPLKVHAHKFRHTWATRALDAGVSMEALRLAGGWTTYAMVQRYVHFSPAHVMAAWQRRTD
jgi:site-specific recombinase XerD